MKDLKAGDVLTKDNVPVIHPGLSKKMKQDVQRGTALSWQMIG